MPPQVPASVARSFEALTPTVIVLLFVSTITMFIGVDVHKIVGSIVAPLVQADRFNLLCYCSNRSYHNSSGHLVSTVRSIDRISCTIQL